jgi:hypothetical protein
MDFAPLQQLMHALHSLSINLKTFALRRVVSLCEFAFGGGVVNA